MAGPLLRAANSAKSPGIRSASKKGAAEYLRLLCLDPAARISLYLDPPASTDAIHIGTILSPHTTTIIFLYSVNCSVQASFRCGIRTCLEAMPLMTRCSEICSCSRSRRCTPPSNPIRKCNSELFHPLRVASGFPSLNLLYLGCSG